MTWRSKFAITRAEHDELMATRRRPLTDEPMQKRNTTGHQATAMESLIDGFINEALRGNQ